MYFHATVDAVVLLKEWNITSWLGKSLYMNYLFPTLLQHMTGYDTLMPTICNIISPKWYHFKNFKDVKSYVLYLAQKQLFEINS